MHSHQGTRNCPTRMDGMPALLSHRVTPRQCSDRQRQHYHKCYTCRFNHARVAELGLPPEESSEETAAEQDEQDEIAASEHPPKADESVRRV